jgi:diguanylate cyclase (GGDEF)-like protein
MQLNTLSERNMKLEKDINVLANIVEISKYINSFLSDENLIAMINDMVVGLLGVAYSTIFIEEDGELVIKATNVNGKKVELTNEEKMYIESGKEYLINSVDGMRRYECSNSKECLTEKICSAMAMPIQMREKSFGFILVEHQLYNFLDKEHKRFLKSIASQIAISMENAILYRELQDNAKKDPLLGIYNRRYFFEVVEKKASTNPNDHYATVMVDLDDFKKINDFYGHQFGDKVLIETNENIRKCLDEQDILARYGGEEIILYIDGFKDKEEVYNKVEAIRKSIEANVISNGDLSKTITASFGIGYYPEDGTTVSEVINEADILLYQSKEKGKNKVTYYGNRK